MWNIFLLIHHIYICLKYDNKSYVYCVSSWKTMLMYVSDCVIEYNNMWQYWLMVCMQCPFPRHVQSIKQTLSCQMYVMVSIKINNIEQIMGFLFQININGPHNIFFYLDVSVTVSSVYWLRMYYYTVRYWLFVIHFRKEIDKQI